MRDYKTKTGSIDGSTPVPKVRRYFSVEVRKQVVAEIDNGLGKMEASRKYEVSETTIYRWLAAYSTKYKKTLVTVVEDASATNKVLKLEAELQAAYADLGRSQSENLFLHKIIELANEDLGVDLKKNIETKLSSYSIKKKHKGL